MGNCQMSTKKTVKLEQWWLVLPLTLTGFTVMFVMQMCLSQPDAVNKVHVMPDILPCSGAECRVKNPRELVYTTTTTTTTRAAGWLEWTEWSDCSATCGSGQISRSRDCFSYSGNESLVCGGYTGSDELDVQDCSLDACTSGVEM